ncbi:ferritin-like domain-containing protein [Clostridium sp. YIM B02515]|uniref:Ferritin-like domain-containing protein n=1 Tax=Clostridium rhizosphaerae TaxID=2803861 RepID=A0ABS1TBL7_9CLOT|nr:ferritin-like domain-containing protein [Clostridium rhizosphaerae]MBL4936740.1 ferritin-like domain-containing protein [Clostridium rhizosphaerae]
MYYGTDQNNYEEMYREQMHQRENVLDLIKEAMKDERHDRIKYKNMMDMAKDEKVKKQIEFAYMDEGKHYKMFQQIYYMLTGKMIDIPAPKVEGYNKLIDAVETSINGELEAVELYRKIQSMLPNQKLRDMLFEIITDEQEHATRFVYVYSILTGK